MDHNTVVESKLFAEFRESVGFPLDPFQKDACIELSYGRSVLVCAPTGAGKTIVGQFAIHLALARGTKCYYTTPIKALSNQKFNELIERYGNENIGLLTGDNTINSSAPIVVMTTEVLRNMLYEKSESLSGLSYVVMDEVHYLADRFRGGVWEEVILQLPENVRLISLSATVSNAEEFGAWIQKIRGQTSVIVDEHRPVPLYQHVLVGNEIIPVYHNNTVNPILEKTIARRERALAQIHQEVETAKNQRNKNFKHKSRGSSYINTKNSVRRNFRTSDAVKEFEFLDRTKIIFILSREGLLPVIYFIFSRAGCDHAFNGCIHSSLVLNSRDCRFKIDEVIEHHLHDISPDDLEIIGFYTWREGLYRGFAAHHAGMLPAFRKVVEELYSSGLLKVVFATETLALGINMPAKSVVVEKLVKYNGEHHVDISPGEFTQLCGRAGRRGIDTEGHAVICWRPGMRAHNIATLASTRTFPLNSSFMPMYNMTLNLVNQLSLPDAVKLIRRSFAQFQYDYKSKSRAYSDGVISSQTDDLESDIENQIAHIDAALLELCPPGTMLYQLQNYIQLSEKFRVLEKKIRKKRKESIQKDVRYALGQCEKFDIISIDNGRKKTYSTIIYSDVHRTEVISQSGKKVTVNVNDIFAVPVKIGQLPTDLRKNIHTETGRKAVGKYLQKCYSNKLAENTFHSVDVSNNSDDPTTIDDICYKISHHSLHSVLTDKHIVPMSAVLLRKRRLLVHSLQGTDYENSVKKDSLERIFTNNIKLLVELGYLSNSNEPKLTTKGKTLLHIYSESDLLIAQCLDAGIWVKLDFAELAAVVSCLVFESRNDQKVQLSHIRGLRSQTISVLDKTIKLWQKLTEREIFYQLRPMREPDLGFASAIYEWANRGELSNVLFLAGEKGNLQSAGDFVRWSRQVIDILEQIAMILPDSSLAYNARIAVDNIKRGIVCAGILG